VTEDPTEQAGKQMKEMKSKKAQDGLSVASG